MDSNTTTRDVMKGKTDLREKKMRRGPNPPINDLRVGLISNKYAHDYPDWQNNTNNSHFIEKAP